MSASSRVPRSTLLFALLCVALSLALVLQQRETRRLRHELVRMTEARASARGLAPGAPLAPIELLDAAGTRVQVDFRAAVGTVVLFHAGACDACAHTAPHWRSALLEAARPDLAVFVAQTDGEAARVDLEGLPPSLAVPLPPVGWPADLPAVPATLVIDAEGVLVRAWYGELGEAERAEFVATLARLGG